MWTLWRRSSILFTNALLHPCAIIDIYFERVVSQLSCMKTELKLSSFSEKQTRINLLFDNICIIGILFLL